MSVFFSEAKLIVAVETCEVYARLKTRNEVAPITHLVGSDEGLVWELLAV